MYQKAVLSANRRQRRRRRDHPELSARGSRPSACRIEPADPTRAGRDRTFFGRPLDKRARSMTYYILGICCHSGAKWRSVIAGRRSGSDGADTEILRRPSGTVAGTPARPLPARPRAGSVDRKGEAMTNRPRGPPGSGRPSSGARGQVPSARGTNEPEGETKWQSN